MSQKPQKIAGIGEKCGETLANIFILQCPGQVAARNFTKNHPQTPQATKPKFFHRETLGVESDGPNSRGQSVRSHFLRSRRSDTIETL